MHTHMHVHVHTRRRLCMRARAQIEAYGMCKVVPPPGWKPPPWSGRPPKGFNERSPITSDSVEAAVRASCRPVRGGDNGHL